MEKVLIIITGENINHKETCGKRQAARLLKLVSNYYPGSFVHIKKQPKKRAEILKNAKV